MKSFLIVVGSFAALVILLVALLFSMDLGWFKGTITGLASDYLGREVAIDDLSILLDDRLTVSVRELQLASTPWTGEKDLLRVGRLDLTLDYWTLLSDVIVVDTVESSDVQVNLVVNSAGENNFSLPALASDEPSADSTTRVFLSQGALSDIRIRYDAPEFESPQVVVADVSVAQTPDDLLAITLNGALNDAPISASGNIGTMDNLMEAANVSFDLSVSLGDIQLRGSGLIDDLAEPRHPEAAMVLTGPSARQVTDILELDPVTTGPIQMNVSMGPEPSGFTLKADGAYGEFAIDLNARLSSLQETENVEVSLKASGPSLATLGQLAGRSDIPSKPFAVELSLHKEGQRLSLNHLAFKAGDAQLDAVALVPELPGLAGATADVTLRGPQLGPFSRLLGLSESLSGPFEATASLVRAEKLGRLNASLASDAGELAVNASISDEQDLTGSTAIIEVSSKDASRLAHALDMENVPALPLSARFDTAIEHAGIRIDTGTVALGSDSVNFHGFIGRDPLAIVTALHGSAKIPDLASSLLAFQLEAGPLPVRALDIDFDVGRSESAYLLDSTITADDRTQLKLNAHIGDSLALADMRFDLEANGSDLATLIPADLEAQSADLPQGPFVAGGRISFAEEHILLSDGNAEFAGAKIRIDLRTPLANPFTTASVDVDLRGSSLAALVPQSAAYLEEDASYSVAGQAAWNQERVTLTDVRIQAGAASVTTDGHVSLSADANSALSLETSLPTLHALQFLTEATLPDEPLTLSMDISGDSGNMIASIHRLSLGPSSLTGEASLQPAATDDDVPEIEAYVRSPLLDLRPFADWLDSEERPASSEDPASDGRVIPDQTLPFELLGVVNAKVDFLAERLITPNMDVTDVTLRAELTDRRLHVERASLTGPRGTLGASLNLIPYDNGAALNLHMDGADLTLGLPAETPDELATLPRYDLTVELDSKGATPRDHAATATGYIKGVSGTGLVDISALGLFTRDFAGEVLNTVNPFVKKDSHSVVQCLGVLIEMVDGELFGDPALVFQTDKLNIAAVAKVDLATEKLSLAFKTQARKGLGISMGDILSPYTEIGGSLAHPKLQLNSKSALFQGSATIATVGISFLAQKAHQRLLADKNPCRSAILAAEADIESREED